MAVGPHAQRSQKAVVSLSFCGPPQPSFALTALPPLSLPLLSPSADDSSPSSPSKDDPNAPKGFVGTWKPHRRAPVLSSHTFYCASPRTLPTHFKFPHEEVIVRPFSCSSNCNTHAAHVVSPRAHVVCTFSPVVSSLFFSPVLPSFSNAFPLHPPNACSALLHSASLRPARLPHHPLATPQGRRSTRRRKQPERLSPSQNQ